MEDDTELAADLWRKYFPERVKRVSKVEFEYAPSPKGKYLLDSTAFDVYFENINPKDENGFINSFLNDLY